MTFTRHFIHRESKPLDPEFLQEERRFLDRQRESLRLMEKHREQLERDVKSARHRAHELGISLNHAPESGYRAWLALIGVGNRFRRDDGAGLEVAARLRAAKPPGCRILEERAEPVSLIEDFALVKEALVVDAVSSALSRERFIALTPPQSHYPLSSSTRRPMRLELPTPSSWPASSTAFLPVSPSTGSRARASRRVRGSRRPSRRRSIRLSPSSATSSACIRPETAPRPASARSPATAARRSALHPDPEVDRDGARRPGQHGVEIEFGDFMVGLDHRTYAKKELLDHVEVHLGSPAKPCQQREGGERAEHLARPRLV